MDEASRAAVEADILAQCDVKDFRRATTIAVQAYGPELLGFLVALVGDYEEAADVFSQLCEDLWKGLPGFERRASFRTWAYTLARHAAHRYQRTRQRHRKHNVPLSSDISRIEQKVRTSTLSYLRSQKKNRLTELRATLPVEDQTLLILRVDRKLGWTDIARVLSDEKLEDDAALDRESARLRKRFQLVKDKLRELAKKEGLLPED